MWEQTRIGKNENIKKFSMKLSQSYFMSSLLEGVFVQFEI
jgi:hypothetical protein